MKSSLQLYTERLTAGITVSIGLLKREVLEYSGVYPLSDPWTTSLPFILCYLVLAVVITLKYRHIREAGFIWLWAGLVVWPLSSMILLYLFRYAYASGWIYPVTFTRGALIADRFHQFASLAPFVSCLLTLIAVCLLYREHKELLFQRRRQWRKIALFVAVPVLLALVSRSLLFASEMSSPRHHSASAECDALTELAYAVKSHPYALRLSIRWTESQGVGHDVAHAIIYYRWRGRFVHIANNRVRLQCSEVDDSNFVGASYGCFADYLSAFRSVGRACS